MEISARSAIIYALEICLDFNLASREVGQYRGRGDVSEIEESGVVDESDGGREKETDLEDFPHAATTVL